MTALRKEWSLHVAAGALSVLDGSTFGFDRSWSPQGAGMLSLPLDDPLVETLQERDTQPMLLVCDLWHTTPGAFLGAVTPAGLTLGASSWPADTGVTKYADEYSDALPHRRIAWHVWPGYLRRDHGERIAQLPVSTAELRLVETRNGGDAWRPMPTAPGPTYMLRDVVAQLLAYLGVQVAVAGITSYPIPAADVGEWQPGDDAWSYITRLRIAAGCAYRYDAQTNTLRFLPIATPGTGVLPAEWLDRVDDLGGGESDGDQYADAVLLEWSWTAADGTQRTQRDLALAPGLTDWRQARRLRTIRRDMAPIPGYAQLLVAELSRWLVVNELSLPLEYDSLIDLVTGSGQWAQQVQYRIADEPTVAVQIITED